MLFEIRPGSGGDDAAAFAGELAELICTTASRCGLRAALDASNPRLLTVELASTPRWAGLLAGTHRSQRIPAGAAARHTSTVTVAVIDDPTEPAHRPAVDPSEVTVETYRASGPGGQHRNTSDTAVRLTHHPSGLVVTCADSRSQHHNRVAAFAELDRRLAERARAAHAEHLNDARVSQFSDDRSPSRTWTWNFQRGRATHHPTGRTWRITDLQRGRGLGR